MRKHNLFILAAIVFVVTTFMVACQQSGVSFECTDAIGCVDIGPDEPVKLGVIRDMSGGAASIGIEQANITDLALSHRGNQLLGHPITVQREDTGCSAEGGSVAAAKLVTDPQVVAILGTTCSGAAVPASEIMSKSGLVMVSGVNSASSLTSLDGIKGANWHPGYFRTRHNDVGIGQAAATFALQKLGATKVATINDGDAYTKGLTDVFQRTFEELGGEIVLDATVNKGETDMEPVLTAVAMSGAELVFLAIFPPEAVPLVRQAKKTSELEDVALMGVTSLIVDPFIKDISADGMGMYFVSWAALDSLANDELVLEYEAKYGEPPPSTTYGATYDAAKLLLNAIESVAVQERDGTLHVGRQALRDALYATVDFEGVSGALTCDQFGDCGVGRFAILRLDDPSAGLEGMWSNVIYTYAPEQ